MHISMYIMVYVLKAIALHECTGYTDIVSIIRNKLATDVAIHKLLIELKKDKIRLKKIHVPWFRVVWTISSVAEWAAFHRRSGRDHHALICLARALFTRVAIIHVIQMKSIRLSPWCIMHAIKIHVFILTMLYAEALVHDLYSISVKMHFAFMRPLCKWFQSTITTTTIL